MISVINKFAQKQVEIWQDNLRKVRATGERRNRHGFGDGSLFRHLTRQGIRVAELSRGVFSISTDIPMYGIYFSAGVGRGTKGGEQSESKRRAAHWLERRGWYSMLKKIQAYTQNYISKQLDEAWNN